MQKVIVIVGQTATGKSSLAVKIAKNLARMGGIRGEIISADSRQVYSGLNIGTGKITEQEMKGVPHHLLNVANTKNKFTVTKYKKLADNKIKEIIARGHTPIIVGGTGFYIDAVTKGVIFPEVPPNAKLRQELNKKSTEELFKILKKLDKARAKSIDAQNKVRLVRAIEIAQALGKVPTFTAVKPLYELIKIGLCLPEDQLRNKVTKRVKQMFADGLLGEIQELKKAGVSNKRIKEFGFEYDDPTPDKVISETIKYAKRQMTWFKRDADIKWFSPIEYSKIEKFIKSKKLLGF